MSDIFREVEEDLRHEHYKRLWDKFGIYVIGVAVLIIAATAGYRGWQAWQASQAADAGDRFAAALRSLDDGEVDGAKERLAAIGKDGPKGYAALARVRAASVMAQSGDVDNAKKAFEGIISDTSLDQMFRDAARVHYGYLLIDNGSVEDVKKQVSGLIKPDQPWRHSARELIGLASYKAEDLAAARKWFQEAADDNAAPADLSARSRIMLALIQAAEPADETAEENKGEGQ